MVEHYEATDSGVDSAAVQEQLKRILADRLFQASKRYSDMLAYIVERTLNCQHESLKERIIGIEVFERPPDYDTSVDSIVRVAAAEVRKRLARYYLAIGREQELRIELPIRSYVAEFRLPAQVNEKQGPSPEIPATHGALNEERTITQSRKPGIRPQSIRDYALWCGLAACLLLGAGWGVQQMYASGRALDRFWAPMLKSSGKPLISIGSPIWLLSSSAASDALPLPAPGGTTYSEWIAQQENYPIADLSAASALTSFLARHQQDSVIRLADSATLSELHGNPLIVLGSFPNEWALRLGADLPFTFRREGELQGIEETSGRGGRRWMIKLRSPYEQVTSEYALITRAVDKTTEQWWIGIGGVTVLGTNAAQRIMVDPHEMTTITAGLPQDWYRKNLQFVIEISMVKGSPGASKVIAAKTW